MALKTRIHPELQRAAKSSPAVDFNKSNIRFINFMMSLMFRPQQAADLSIRNIYIPAIEDSGRKIRLRVYKPTPEPASAPVLLWLHGGGYVIGRPEMDDLVCMGYARELGIAVVSVDYRLAPKHPFPAGLHDAYTALAWVASQESVMGFDTTRIAVGGQSAGGGLAAALAQMAHDRREIPLAFQLLIYPMLDDRTALRTDIDDRENRTWTQKSNRYAWEAYLGGKYGAETVPQYAVPARREDLAELPPAWIGVGDLDIFHDENLAYGRRLVESGVACETRVFPGAFHGFDRFAPESSMVRDFNQTQIAALRKYLQT